MDWAVGELGVRVRAGPPPVPSPAQPGTGHRLERLTQHALHLYHLGIARTT